MNLYVLDGKYLALVSHKTLFRKCLTFFGPNAQL